jgi:MarR family transcriptional regulator, temperature-dependent positive regulator of motility
MDDLQEEAGSPAPFDLNSSPSHLLHRAQQAAAERFAVAFGADGPTLRQVAVLAAVSAREGLTQTELVRTTGVDRSTLAEMVARMTSRGLLARSKSETDARANAVRLTDAGRAALAAAEPTLLAVDAAVIALVPKAKRAAFLEALTRIALDEPAPAESVAKPAKAEKPAKPEKAEKPEKKKKKKKKK